MASMSRGAELVDVIETVKALTPELILYLKSHTKDLEKIDPLLFEHLVAEFLAQRGFRTFGSLDRTLILPQTFTQWRGEFRGSDY